MLVHTGRRARKTITPDRSRIAFAVLTIASLALLLYTVGAPFNHGG